MSSIFTQIIKGELPAMKIYEDEHTYAFIDIFPIRLGHSLIVPKVETDYFLDVEEPYYSAVFKTAKKIAPAIQAATNCKRIGTAIMGFEVPHFHYHLIPMDSLEDCDLRVKLKVTKEELKAVYEKILANMN